MAVPSQPGRAALRLGPWVSNAERVSARQALRGAGVRNPAPETGFFLHRDQYEWGLPFEWALACYWTGDLYQALTAHKRILKIRSLPKDIREAVEENRRRILALTAEKDGAGSCAATEVAPLRSLAPEARIGEVRLNLDPSWTQSSPSIASGDEGCRMLLRTSEIAGEGTSHRIVYVDVELAEDLSIASTRPVSDESFRRVCRSETSGAAG